MVGPLHEPTDARGVGDASTSLEDISSARIVNRGASFAVDQGETRHYTAKSMKHDEELVTNKGCHTAYLVTGRERACTTCRSCRGYCNIREPAG